MIRMMNQNESKIIHNILIIYICILLLILNKDFIECSKIKILMQKYQNNNSFHIGNIVIKVY
jgi:hypothetical protein